MRGAGGMPGRDLPKGPKGRCQRSIYISRSIEDDIRKRLEVENLQKCNFSVHRVTCSLVVCYLTFLLTLWQWQWQFGLAAQLPPWIWTGPGFNSHFL